VERDSKRSLDSLSLVLTNQLSNQEWGTYLDTTQPKKNDQMARMGWIGIFVNPVVMLDYYLGDSPNNQTGWGIEDFDSLLMQAKVEQDLATMLKKYK